MFKDNIFKVIILLFITTCINASCKENNESNFDQISNINVVVNEDKNDIQDPWDYVYSLSQNTSENRKEIDRLFFNAKVDNEDYLNEQLGVVFLFMDDHGKDYLMKSLTTRSKLRLTMYIVTTLGKYSPVSDEILLVKNDRSINPRMIIHAIGSVGKINDNIHRYILDIIKDCNSNSDTEAAVDCIVDLKMFDREVHDAIVELIKKDKIDKKQIITVIARSSLSQWDENSELIDIVRNIYNNEKDEDIRLLAAVYLFMQKRDVSIDHIQLLFNNNRNDQVKLLVSLFLLNINEIGTYLTSSLSSKNEDKRLYAFWTCSRYYHDNCVLLMNYWLKGLNDVINIQRHSMSIINKLNLNTIDRNNFAKSLIMNINDIEPRVTWELLRYIEENIDTIDEKYKCKLIDISRKCKYKHIISLIDRLLDKH